MSSQDLLLLLFLLAHFSEFEVLHKNELYKFKIEIVKRKFTRKLVGFNDVSYRARLKALKLPSLEQRRLTADLILTYKIIFGYTVLNLTWMTIFYLKYEIELSHEVINLKLVLTTATLTLGKTFLAKQLLMCGILYQKVVDYLSLKKLN